MSLEVKALNSRTRLSLSTPNTAHEFHINELRRSASKKKWIFDIVTDTDNPWISMKLKDSRNRVYTVEIFDRFYTKLQCSCQKFLMDEANYCLHTGAIDNLRGNRRVYQTTQQIPDFVQFWGIFDRMMNRLPISLKGHKGAYFSYFNTLEGRVETIGSGKAEPVKSVTIQTIERYSTRRVATPQVELPDPDDAGLLDGINLYDYQQNVFQKMLRAKRAICSMSMGAGKTLTTIACYKWILKNVNPDARCLIIAPKSLRLQWGSELERSIHETATQVTKVEHLQRDCKVFIATYQYFTRNVDKFLDQQYDLIVADEIQFVRNADTKTWKAISKIRSPYFYGLSGTVIENRLDDLFSIMQIVNPGLLGPRWRFNERFQNLTTISRNKILYKGVKNLDILQDRLRDHVFSYSNLKLPGIQYHTIDSDLSATEMNYHDDNMEQAKVLIAKSLNGNASHFDHLRIQALLLKARQACNGEELITKEQSRYPSSKVQKFLELVQEVCVQKNEKLVVFSEWTEMLAICQRFLPANIKYVSYTGDQTPKKRAANLEKFQNDPDCKIFFSSDAGGVGLDGLQLVSCHVIHLELPWNPSRLDQRTGRLYRLQQTKPVNCYYLVSNGGIERNILSLLSEKREVRISTLADLV
jgi:SNF2 family DNA or RNA helicase